MLINNNILSKSGNFPTGKLHVRLQFNSRGRIDLLFSGNLRASWVEHSRTGLGTCSKATCSFQPLNSLSVVFAEHTQLMEVKCTDQSQSAQHRAGSNLRHPGQDRIRGCACLWLLAMHIS